MKIVRAILLTTTALVIPSAGAADPVTAFFLAFSGATTTTAAVAAALYPGLTAVGSFLGTTLIGNLLLNIGLSYLTRPRSRSDTAESRVNSRLEISPRRQLAGPVAVGGEVSIFTEEDEDGNFWYIIAHGDAELTGSPSYMLDGIAVTLSDGTDGFTAGDVLTDDFCLDDGGNIYEGSGTRVPYYRIYTVTPDASNAYGSKPAAFTAAFPNLPADFYLAGVAYSIVRIAAVSLRHRHKLYRWRGALGLGEPAVSVVADFNRMYDQREVGHDIDDDTTWTPSGGNLALIWGWWRTSAYGRGLDMTDINWDKVADAADICDETCLDRNGDPVPLYRGGFAFSDATARGECEAEILKAMDAFVAYDDQGRAYPVPGKYAAPTISFSADRDIFTSATEIIDDGEAAVDGVVVRYTSPEHGYTLQECAAWQNPAYHVSGREPVYHFEDIAGCQNHNQAFRLAGAIGMRIAAERKAALGTTCKGVLARGHRAIELDLDADFTGVHEIVSRIEEDENGLACGFAVVPLAANRWLGAGQTEGAPPQPSPVLNIDDSLTAPANVDIQQVAITVSSGTAYRMEATFDAPDRVDRFYQFRYAATGTTVYEYFTVDMDELLAYSAIVQAGDSFDVSWRTVTAGGRATEWSTVETVTITADNAPADLSSVTASASFGRVSFTGTAGALPSHTGVKVYRATTGAAFGTASAISAVISGTAGAPFDVTVGDASATDIATNGTFDADSDWTKGTGWTIGSGVASKAAGVVASILQAQSMTAGTTYRFTFDLANVTAGSIKARIQGTTSVYGAARSADGTYADSLVAPASPANIVFTPTSDFAGDLDNVIVVEETADCVAHGEADFWIVPVAFDGTEGTPDGPHTLSVL